MSWTKRKLEAKRTTITRTRKAFVYGQIVDTALAAKHFTFADGPTSSPIKLHDPETQALITEALRERGMAV